MAETLKTGERLVCVGQTALRAPDGTPMKGVPMYIIVEESKVNANDGLTDGERSLFRDVGGIFAAKMKAYIEAERSEAGASAVYGASGTPGGLRSRTARTIEGGGLT